VFYDTGVHHGTDGAIDRGHIVGGRNHHKCPGELLASSPPGGGAYVLWDQWAE